MKGGNLFIFGLNGNGKKSLSCLATYINKYELIEISE